MFTQDETSQIVDQVIAARVEEIKVRITAAANRKIDDLLERVQIEVRISEAEFARIVGYSPDTIARMRKQRRIQYRGLANRPYYLFPTDVEAFHAAMLHGPVQKRQKG